MQSKELTEFYKAYLQWVENGASYHDPHFHRGIGLCFPAPYPIFNEMRKQFVRHGLNKDYPFNKNSEDYKDEGNNHAMHLNPLRLKWCKDRIREAE